MKKWTVRKYLLPYQRQVTNDQSRFKIWLAARQVGKSTAVAYESLNLAVNDAGSSIMILSASQRQSDEFINKVRLWLDAINAAYGGSGISKKETTEEVALVNDSRIISLPANPRTIRGFSGHIFLDEFAFHQATKQIWAAIYPMVTRGYKIRITSTPNGRQNMFHDIWERGGDHWSRHETSIYQAVEDGLKVDIALLKQSTPDPVIWAQEYECRFIDQATAFLTYDLIGSVESGQAGRPDSRGDGPFYIGADIGRRRDLTVYWVLEPSGDVLWTREVVDLKEASFSEQDRNLDRLVDRYKPQRICMDQGGLGERVVEDAKARYGRSRVEGLIFTAQIKQVLAQDLRRRFEDKTIRIPPDPAIRDDLHSIRRTTTIAGNIRFDAERNGDGHADRFWALALAVHAGEDGSTTPRINLPRRPVLSMPDKMSGF